MMENQLIIKSALLKIHFIEKKKIRLAYEGPLPLTTFFFFLKKVRREISEDTGPFLKSR